MTRVITINAAKLAQLRQAYHAALAADKGPHDVIRVGQDEFVVAYLKYLIEYAAMRLEGGAR